ncbi:MAG: hypothetical protein IPP32_02005 [Bacteroidetes bacterium]|nr:hypothetical protein [Bacteroidota bacterium]
MISENPGLRKTLFYFSLLMVLVYIALGIAVAFSNFMIEMVPNNRIIIGGILIIYGVFRLYILNRQRKSYIFFQEQKAAKTEENK